MKEEEEFENTRAKREKPLYERRYAKEDNVVEDVDPGYWESESVVLTRSSQLYGNLICIRGFLKTLEKRKVAANNDSVAILQETVEHRKAELRKRLHGKFREMYAQSSDMGYIG